MNIKCAFCIASVLCLLAFAPVQAQTATPPPRKHSLAMPAAVAPPAGQPAPSVQCMVTFGPPVPISALAFSPDGKTLAVGGYQEVLLWDLAGGKLSKRIAVGQVTGFVHALAFGQDGRSLIVAEGTPHSSGVVRVFDVESGKQTSSFEEPKDVVYSLALSPDGKLLAGGGADGVAYIWNMEQMKVAATIEDHGDWVLGVSFSPDGKFLATASADYSSQVWEVGTWKSVKRLLQTDTVHGAAYSADGTLLALAVGGPKDRAIRIRRTNDARQTRVIGLGATMPLDVVWAPKGNKLYIPCSDNTLKVYNAANGALIASLDGHGDWVYCVAVNADETRFASGSADGTVKLWGGADNKLLATFIQLTPRTDEWLVITPNGYLATSSAGALEWKTTNVPAPDKLKSLYQNPEAVQKEIAGEDVAPPALQ